MQATTNVPSNFSQSCCDTLMINDTTDRDLEEVVPCMALSNNDFYVLSASGGKVSLFTLITFKVTNCFTLVGLTNVVIFPML